MMIATCIGMDLVRPSNPAKNALVGGDYNDRTNENARAVSGTRWVQLIARSWRAATDTWLVAVEDRLDDRFGLGSGNGRSHARGKWKFRGFARRIAP
jgi:hypothetical protein